jgi:hypothetical protein
LRCALAQRRIDRVKLALNLVPSPFTTEMIASEMPAAIRPYSIG